MKEPLTRIELGLIRVYRGAICPACGKPKESKRLFCKTCYFSLDTKTRNSIHVRIDEDAFYDTYLRVIDRLVKANVGVSFDKMPLESRRILDEAGLADALWHQPMKLWIVLDNGRPLTVKPNGDPVQSQFGRGFRRYEEAYALRERRRREYWQAANKAQHCKTPCSFTEYICCDARRLIVQGHGVKVMRVEAQ